MTLSSEPNDVTVVCVRVMPFVGLPAGSVGARKNSTRLSAISGWKAGGTVPMSVFVARKSRFRTSIWLSTWASEMFCPASFHTTCTTTGIRTTPVKRSPARPVSSDRVRVSIVLRACR